MTSPEGYLLALWAHECERVFADKLITLEDKGWVEGAVQELATQVGGRGGGGGGAAAAAGERGAADTVVVGQQAQG